MVNPFGFSSGYGLLTTVGNQITRTVVLWVTDLSLPYSCMYINVAFFCVVGVISFLKLKFNSHDFFFVIAASLFDWDRNFSRLHYL